jgi:hypothetical protein
MAHASTRPDPHHHGRLRWTSAARTDGAGDRRWNLGEWLADPESNNLQKPFTVAALVLDCRGDKGVGRRTVLEHFRHFAHLKRKPNFAEDQQPLVSSPRPSLPTFRGAFIAALIATVFWAALIFLILWLK